MEEQFTKLVFNLLRQAAPNSGEARTLILVLDGLDKCSNEKDVEVLLRLLIKAACFDGCGLKLLTTSRPEVAVRDACGSPNNDLYRELRLHDTSNEIVSKDISLYLQHQLTEPGQKKINALVDITIPLFLFAAIACRLIRDELFGIPEEQLLKLVQTVRKGGVSDKLQETYQPVLKQFRGERIPSERTILLERFRQVIGAIILLEQPLSISSIASLLCLKPSQINGILLPLRLVALSERNGNIMVWSLALDVFMTNIRMPSSHSVDPYVPVTFFKDLKRIASALQGFIYVYVAETGEELFHTLYHEGGSFVSFSPNPEIVATLSVRGGVHLWEVSTGVCLRAFGTNGPVVSQLAFVSDTNLLIVKEADGEIRTLDIDTGRWTSRASGGEVTRGPVAFSHDSKLIAHQILPGSDAISNSSFDTGEHYQFLDLTCILLFKPFSVLSLRPEYWVAAFSPAGKFLIVAQSNRVAIWSLFMIRKPRTLGSGLNQPMQPMSAQIKICFINRIVSEEKAKIISMDESDDFNEVSI
ncbi:pfs domain-containing protein [Colletotrichum acutatum]